MGVAHSYFVAFFICIMCCVQNRSNFM